MVQYSLKLFGNSKQLSFSDSKSQNIASDYTLFQLLAIDIPNSGKASLLVLLRRFSATLLWGSGPKWAPELLCFEMFLLSRQSLGSMLSERSCK